MCTCTRVCAHTHTEAYQRLKTKEKKRISKPVGENETLNTKEHR